VRHVNIIGKSNGVGLDRDVRLLAEVLRQAGCKVSFTRTDSRQSGRRKSPLFKALRMLKRRLLPRPEPRHDINLMLEHVWTQYVDDARLNVLVPNPDFFDRHDVVALSYVDRVWAKTRQGEQLFRNLGSKVALIGFDSEDRYDAGAPRVRTFFHLAGSSELKGTQRLLSIWAQHPKWPLLIVAGRLKFVAPKADNIRIYGGYLDDGFLKQLQNESMVHVCTSEAEGWGHYLVEAMSCAAAVITVDAPPMNELIAPDRGWLLPCFLNGQHRLTPRHAFVEDALVAQVEQVMAMPIADVTACGAKGREWYLSNRAGFFSRIRHALAETEETG
jgi:glycosyltransferase involved in cell wall biosynthesis